MKRGIYNISIYDKGKIGLQYENLNEVYYNYSVKDCYYMFAVSFFGTLLIGIYLINVLPNSSDIIRKPWYYPVSPTYWCGSKISRKNKKRNLIHAKVKTNKKINLEGSHHKKD